jgi:5-methylcytosine-specific restriction protein A
MPSRAMRPCVYPGCRELTTDGHCAKHPKKENRGSAYERGYTHRWDKQAKLFLSRPENQFCVLRLDKDCNRLSQCVDHIDPPNGPDDPRFFNENNWQPACIHCNSVKGHRYLKGTYKPFDKGGKEL